MYMLITEWRLFAGSEQIFQVMKPIPIRIIFEKYPKDVRMNRKPWVTAYWFMNLIKFVFWKSSKKKFARVESRRDKAMYQIHQDAAVRIDPYFWFPWELLLCRCCLLECSYNALKNPYEHRRFRKNCEWEYEWSKLEKGVNFVFTALVVLSFLKL